MSDGIYREYLYGIDPDRGAIIVPPEDSLARKVQKVNTEVSYIKDSRFARLEFAEAIEYAVSRGFPKFLFRGVTFGIEQAEQILEAAGGKCWWRRK